MMGNCERKISPIFSISSADMSNCETKISPISSVSSATIFIKHPVVRDVYTICQIKSGSIFFLIFLQLLFLCRIFCFSSSLQDKTISAIRNSVIIAQGRKRRD